MWQTHNNTLLVRNLVARIPPNKIGGPTRCHRASLSDKIYGFKRAARRMVSSLSSTTSSSTFCTTKRAYPLVVGAHFRVFSTESYHYYFYLFFSRANIFVKSPISCASKKFKIKLASARSFNQDKLFSFLLKGLIHFHTHKRVPDWPSTDGKLSAAEY